MYGKMQESGFIEIIPLICTLAIYGLPWWFSGYRICLQYRRTKFDSWFRNISWGRKWQPTPVFLPGKSHG